MSRKAHITSNMFNAIKIMLNGGATGKEVEEYLGVSDSTVSRIKKAETFEEYRQMCAATHAYYLKKKAKEEQKKAEQEQKAKEAAEQVDMNSAPQKQEYQKPVVHSVTIQATHYMMEEMQKTNDLLKLINNKLGAIIDDLYGTGVKKDA